MIVLVTGTPGSGKTLFVVSKILELQKQFPDRKIYSDIDGLQIDGVEPSPDDWRTTPDNSIVIYDEAQQHERFRAGTQANKDEVVQALQVHRHTGHDIWFITQSPRFLNAFVLDLVGEHFHLHRPYGAKLASVYYWRSVRKQPQSLASRELAENEFLFKYPKQLFDVYKSATQHNVKLKIPKKLWMIVGAFVLMGLFVLKMIYSDGSQKMLNGTLGTAPVAATVHPVKNISDTELESKVALCMQQFKWTREQCLTAYDPQAQQIKNDNLEQSTGNSIDQVIFDYNPSKPFDVVYEVKARPTDFPKFSGCMKLNGRYVAYTQQGTILKDVSSGDCQRVIENGDRPFNYFASSQQQQTQQPQQQIEQPLGEQI